MKPALPGSLIGLLSTLGLDGVANVTCVVDETGRVREMEALDFTDRYFVEPALEAPRTWTFRPATRDGMLRHTTRENTDPFRAQ